MLGQPVAGLGVCPASCAADSSLRNVRRQHRPVVRLGGQREPSRQEQATRRPGKESITRHGTRDPSVMNLVMLIAGHMPRTRNPRTFDCSRLLLRMLGSIRPWFPSLLPAPGRSPPVPAGRGIASAGHSRVPCRCRATPAVCRRRAARSGRPPSGAESRQCVIIGPIQRQPHLAAVRVAGHQQIGVDLAQGEIGHVAQHEMKPLGLRIGDRQRRIERLEQPQAGQLQIAEIERPAGRRPCVTSNPSKILRQSPSGSTFPCTANTPMRRGELHVAQKVVQFAPTASCVAPTAPGGSRRPRG